MKKLSLLLIVFMFGAAVTLKADERPKKPTSTAPVKYGESCNGERGNIGVNSNKNYSPSEVKVNNVSPRVNTSVSTTTEYKNVYNGQIETNTKTEIIPAGTQKTIKTDGYIREVNVECSPK